MFLKIYKKEIVKSSIFIYIIKLFYPKKYKDNLFKSIKQDDIFSIKGIKNSQNET